MWNRLRSAKLTGKRMLIPAFAAAAITLIGGFEGYRPDAYRDSIGIPTICYGETQGVRMGDKKTKAECDALFAARLAEFETGMRKCLTNPDAIPDAPYRTFLSLAYNVGNGAFCGSTLVKKLNAGDIEGACRELPKWNKAGGRVLPGLTNRRLAEQKLCLEGARG